MLVILSAGMPAAGCPGFEALREIDVLISKRPNADAALPAVTSEPPATLKLTSYFHTI